MRMDEHHLMSVNVHVECVECMGDDINVIINAMLVLQHNNHKVLDMCDSNGVLFAVERLWHAAKTCNYLSQ